MNVPVSKICGRMPFARFRSPGRFTLNVHRKTVNSSIKPVRRPEHPRFPKRVLFLLQNAMQTLRNLIAFQNVTGPIGWVRIWGLVLLACAGCNPVAESSKPASTPGASVIPADQQLPTNGKIASTQPDLPRLLSQIRDRLDLMPKVAQAKWNRKLAITDAKREAKLLDELQARGVAQGLPANIVRDFFQAQMTAAKQVQEQHFAGWTKQQQPPFSRPPDLEREIRPKIDQLNEKLLETLGELWAKRSIEDGKGKLDSAAATVMANSPWSEVVVETALKPLYQIVGSGN
ncbi:MAG: chorismate mutase domain protein [Planctomycetaceae bacterium]|nr:chorismate mutase domain protein [Planctomycetaceae bacterium]